MPSVDNFANSLDPDLARQNVRPDLDSNCLTLMVLLKEFFEKVDFEKNQQTSKKHEKLPRMQRVKHMQLVPLPHVLAQIYAKPCN